MLSLIKTLPLRIVAAYLRHSSCAFARWRLQLFAIQQVRRLEALMGNKIVYTRFGVPIALKLSDWVDQQIYATGEYEADVARVIEKLLTAGDCVFDIGANIGYFSLLAAKQVGATGVVESFEPVPAIRERLKHNLRLNPQLPIVLHDEAISDMNGISHFYVGPSTNSGTSSLRSISEASDKIEVRTIRFDALSLNTDSVQLIKIDVEGAEMKVIDGMKDAFQRWGDRLPDLIVEVSDSFLRATGSSGEMLCAKLMKMGYKMYVIEWNGIREVVIWSTELPHQFNALFTVRNSILAGLTPSPV